MNSEDILRYETEQLSNISKCAINEAYVLGQNPTIFEDRTGKKPDNRIPVPLAKSAVEDMTGYAASIGSITIDFNGKVEETSIDEAARKDYISLNKDIYDHNNNDIETTELYNQALTQGEAYELFWVSDDLNLDNGILTPEYTIVDNSEIVLVWSQDIRPSLLAAIRFWISGDMKYADVYYPLYMESWKKQIDKNSNWTRNVDSDKQYPYSSVPLAIYKINRHSQPLFEAEKAMIDAHDNLISKSVNEIDRFNALIALFPDSVDEDFIRELEQYKAIGDLADYDRWPEYLEKNLGKIETFYNQLADRLERLYHKTIKVPDFSDENFAGNSSGVAISYKLMGMEFKAAQIEAYFNSGLKQKQELINEVLNSGTRKWDDYEITIDSKRNIPVDVKARVETAEKLAPLVSKETLLKFIPNNIVGDVQLELEKLDGELFEGIPSDDE